MASKTKTAKSEKKYPQQDNDRYYTEEEEKALEQESRRKMSRLARGCLEMAVLMLVLSGVVYLLEQKAHLSVLYVLPPYTLILCCITASFFLMMAALFSVRRVAFAMFVMLLGGWAGLAVLAMTYLQKPESVTLTIPDTEQSVQFTLITTPISTSLYIEEPIRENVLAHRWKLPIHGKNLPLEELIRLDTRKDGTIGMFYDGQLWAVYDPVMDSWADILTHQEMNESLAPTTPSG